MKTAADEAPVVDWVDFLESILGLPGAEWDEVQVGSLLLLVAAAVCCTAAP